MLSGVVAKKLTRHSSTRARANHNDQCHSSYSHLQIPFPGGTTSTWFGREWGQRAYKYGSFVWFEVRLRCSTVGDSICAYYGTAVSVGRRSRRHDGIVTRAAGTIWQFPATRRCRRTGTSVLSDDRCYVLQASSGAGQSEVGRGCLW